MKNLQKNLCSNKDFLEKDISISEVVLHNLRECLFLDRNPNIKILAAIFSRRRFSLKKFERIFLNYHFIKEDIL